VRTLTYNLLAVPVHEHLLRTTDLLAHGIVDRVTGAPLGSADLAPLARNRLSTAASQCSLAAWRLSSPNGLFPLGDFPKSAQATGSPAPRAVRKHLWYLELAALEQLRGMYPLFEWQCT
jgi:hypothetical protein